MKFDRLPEPGTMAAELVGDVTQFSDGHLRRMQEISLISSFSIGGSHMHFKRHGLTEKDLEISRRGWCIARPDGIAHKIAEMPLRWTPDSAPALLYAENEGNDFTGFEGRFLPTIAQRVASALAILDVHPRSESSFGLGIISKARRDLCEILVHYPVLMHPMVQVVNTRGPKSPATHIPLPLAIQRSHSGVLPSAEMGFTEAQLKSFANHPCVQIALDRKLTKEVLKSSGANSTVFEGNRIAGRLNKTYGENYDFSLSAMALQCHREEKAESWMAFECLDDAPEQAHKYPGDFYEFTKMIAHYIARDAAAREEFVANPSIRSMASMASFESLSMYAPIAAVFRGTETPPAELISSTIEIMQGLQIESDPHLICQRLFVSSTKWSANDEYAMNAFIEAVTPHLNSVSDLRQYMAKCQLPIPQPWDQILNVHENRQSMQRAMERSMEAVSTSLGMTWQPKGAQTQSPRSARRGI